MDICVVLYGGVECFLGINLIVFGFFVKDSYLMIVDMVISVIVFGKILYVKEIGKLIGYGLVLDKEGYIIIDLYKIENLLFFGGYKGFGIVLVIDVFMGVLMGVNFSNYIVWMYGDYDKMCKLVSLVIVIDLQMLGNLLFFLIMSIMVNELRVVKLMFGVDKVLVLNDL